MMKDRRLCYKRQFLIGPFLIMAGIFESTNADIQEVCPNDELSITCKHDEVMLMMAAEFGRMDLGKCIKKQDEFLGCTNNVLLLLDKWCSGRRDCTVRVSNDDLEAANKNCLDFLKQYLKVEYMCLKVEIQCSSNTRNKLAGDVGYLSSLTRIKRGCGSFRSPWIISANPGQTIQLDLIDFSSSLPPSNLINCPFVYGYILEKSLAINRTICGGRQRKGELYVSKTNAVEIVLLSSSNQEDKHFLIKYTVTGCSEMTRPPHAWYKREGNEVVIGCHDNKKEWHLTCIGTTWRGEIGNCTETISVIKPERTKIEEFGISSVVVISGIAGIAIVLSVVAIMIGVVYLNRYRISQEVKRSSLYKTYLTIDRNAPGYYMPTSAGQTVEDAGVAWEMSLPSDIQNVRPPFSVDQCACATLQMRASDDDQNAVKKMSLERQSLYSSIKST